MIYFLIAHYALMVGLGALALKSFNEGLWFNGVYALILVACVAALAYLAHDMRGKGEL